MPEVKPRSYWEELVAEYEGSGQEHKTFAAEKGVNVWTFQGWLYRLRRERSAPKSRRRVRMLPVQMAAAKVDVVPRLELAAAGVVLRFDGGADPGFIVKLVSELE